MMKTWKKNDLLQQFPQNLIFQSRKESEFRFKKGLREFKKQKLNLKTRQSLRIIDEEQQNEDKNISRISVKRRKRLLPESDLVSLTVQMVYKSNSSIMPLLHMTLTNLLKSILCTTKNNSCQFTTIFTMFTFKRRFL